MIVVDTNVIVQFVAAGDEYVAAARLYRRDSAWSAPPILMSELRNVLVGLVRRGEITEEQAKAMTDDASAILGDRGSGRLRSADNSGGPRVRSHCVRRRVRRARERSTRPTRHLGPGNPEWRTGRRRLPGDPRRASGRIRARTFPIGGGKLHRAPTATCRPRTPDNNSEGRPRPALRSLRVVRGTGASLEGPRSGTLRHLRSGALQAGGCRKAVWGCAVRCAERRACRSGWRPAFQAGASLKRAGDGWFPVPSRGGGGRRRGPSGRGAGASGSSRCRAEPSTRRAGWMTPNR